MAIPSSEAWLNTRAGCEHVGIPSLASYMKRLGVSVRHKAVLQVLVGSRDFA